MTSIVIENPAVSWRLLMGETDRAGAFYPFADASKGSLFLQTGATDNASALFMKVADNNADADWVEVASPNLNLPVSVTRYIQLPIATGGGTSDIETFRLAPSINLDADGETFYTSFYVPDDWDEASVLVLRIAVGNEIAEDDGDDVSLTLTVFPASFGFAMDTSGLTVEVAKNLTGGTEAINVVNKCNAQIAYDDVTYPVVVGDLVTVKAVVNLAGAGEATGPLHVVGMWVEYQSVNL